jgi:hypothetical protein
MGETGDDERGVGDIQVEYQFRKEDIKAQLIEVR